MIALVMARKNSERVKNKLLRSFADSTLLEIAIEKYKQLELPVYICTGDKKIIDIVKKYDIKYIKRNKESITGESFKHVYNFIDKIPDKNIMILNPCFPLIKIETIKSCIDIYIKQRPLSLITSKREANSVYYKDKLINSSTIPGNSKYSTKIDISAPAVQIWKKQIALRYKYPYRNNANDPYLYSISLLESTDINTEEEFKIAEVLYKNFKE